MLISLSETVNVSLSIEETEKLLDKEIADKTITGEKIDNYPITHGKVLIYRKGFYGSGNLLTMTVVLEKTSQYTTVHWNIGEPVQDFLNTAGRFDKMMRKILATYIV